MQRQASLAREPPPVCKEKETNPTLNHPPIGLIGVGLMGYRIALNLAQKGHSLTVLEHAGNQSLAELHPHLTLGKSIGMRRRWGAARAQACRHGADQRGRDLGRR